MKATMYARALPLIAATLMLAGCDIPGMGPDPKTLQKEAEAKAIGGACRHAMRGLEDCYTLNPKAIKSAVFEGWRDMDVYMRENKIDGIPSVVPLPKPEPPPTENKDKDSEPKEKEKEKGGKH